MIHYDAIILGGGLSGLSLALSLSKQKILILENRLKYVGDRTWCFWNVETHPFEKQIQHRWNRWQVRYQGQHVSISSKQYQYHCLPSENFYQEALQELQKRSEVTHLMDVQVLFIKEERTHVIVETNQGTFRGLIAYDSRPSIETCSLYQHFHGWKIESPQAIFDPHEVILMDFEVPQNQGLNFMYVLPFSMTEALIESTFISASPHSLEVYEEAIKNYLHSKYHLQTYHILYRETGALPLRIKVAPGGARTIPIGTRGGWMRASTGYAFLSIQRRVKNLNMKNKWLENYLDSLFLSFLSEYPDQGPGLFFNLFKNNSADRMVRFLSGTWSYRDLVKILLKMPKWAMIKQALK